MSESMLGNWSELTAEQEEIVALPPSTRILVTAGAGTGKTHVLAGRLARLIGDYNLMPGSEILILSFSRAAVSEMRRRLALRGDSTGYAAAYTFDSFATRLLARIEPDGEWMTLRYDGRIAAVIDKIKADGAASEELKRYRHILIDEIQDLVGCRALLVLGLLTQCMCGFTLFGDPAQAIFEYNSSKSNVAMSSIELYGTIRSTFRPDLAERTLDRNFRATSAQGRKAASFGPHLREPVPHYSAIRKDIDTFILGLMPVGELKAIAPSFRRGAGGSTAILCRNNAQAMLISRRLSELQVQHRLQRDATDRAAAGWIALAVEGLTSIRAGKSQVISRLTTLSERVGLPPDGMWSLLKMLDPRRSNDLDIRAIASRISAGAIPEELNQVVEANVVVSTIHRAKGLEFDRVILVEPDRPDADEDASEETRLLYVAITRARQQILSMQAPNTKEMYLHKAAGLRWVRGGRGPNRRRVFAVEVRPRDTDSTHPAGGYILTNVDVPETQAYLRDSVKPADAVSLKLVSATGIGQPRAFYAIIHRDRVVGITSEEFSENLLHVVQRSRSVVWPNRLTNLHVETIDTVAGSGSGGLWQRVRVQGLAEFE